MASEKESEALAPEKLVATTKSDELPVSKNTNMALTSTEAVECNTKLTTKKDKGKVISKKTNKQTTTNKGQTLTLVRRSSRITQKVSPNKNKDHLTSLIPEILLSVIQNLPVGDWPQLAQTNKEIRIFFDGNAAYLCNYLVTSVKDLSAMAAALKSEKRGDWLVPRHPLFMLEAWFGMISGQLWSRGSCHYVEALADLTYGYTWTFYESDWTRRFNFLQLLNIFFTPWLLDAKKDGSAKTKPWMDTRAFPSREFASNLEAAKSRAILNDATIRVEGLTYAMAIWSTLVGALV